MQTLLIPIFMNPFSIAVQADNLILIKKFIQEHHELYYWVFIIVKKLSK